MIGFIKGILREKNFDQITVETNGVGFVLTVTNSCMVSLPEIDEEVKIYTYMHVREDEISLFGFVSPEEKRLFLQLITVSGVGSKTAIQILSCARMNEIVSAIVNEDVDIIARCKGIGRKTAERIVLELKDKIKPFDYILPNEQVFVNTNNQNIDEAVVVLTSLGVNKNRATEIAKEVAEKSDTAEEIVAKALQFMGK